MAVWVGRECDRCGEKMKTELVGGIVNSGMLLVPQPATVRAPAGWACSNGSDLCRSCSSAYKRWLSDGVGRVAGV